MLDEDFNVLWKLSSWDSSKTEIAWLWEVNLISWATWTFTYDNYYSRKLESFTNIVCLWDSNTAWNNLSNYQRYSNQLNSEFRNEWVTLRNAWISWDTAVLISARLATDLFPYKVDWARNIATLLVWTNDLNSLTPAQTWANIQTLIWEIQAEGWELMVMTYIPENWDTVKNDKLKDYNAFIRENANSVWYTVIDLWTAFADPDDTNDDTTRTGLLQWDWLHMTVVWNQVVADILKLIIALPKKEVNIVNWWHDVTFISSWVNYWSVFWIAQYMKTKDNTVFIKWLVKNGTAAGVFYLPEWFRPVGHINYVVDTATWPISARVQSDWLVKFVWTYSTSYSSLDISFNISE